MQVSSRQTMQAGFHFSTVAQVALVHAMVLHSKELSCILRVVYRQATAWRCTDLTF